MSDIDLTIREHCIRYKKLNIFVPILPVTVKSCYGDSGCSMS